MPSIVYSVDSTPTEQIKRLHQIALILWRFQQTTLLMIALLDSDHNFLCHIQIINLLYYSALQKKPKLSKKKLEFMLILILYVRPSKNLTLVATREYKKYLLCRALYYQGCEMPLFHNFWLPGRRLSQRLEFDKFFAKKEWNWSFWFSVIDFNCLRR